MRNASGTGNAVWCDRAAGAAGLDCAAAAGGAPPTLPHHGRRRARLACEADYTAKVQQGGTAPAGGVVNVRMARLLTRLYPRAWRQRYGKEFQAFLEAERAGLRGSCNIVWSALCEHTMPTQRGDMAQSSRAVQFHSWCIRAPWAVFGLAPLLLLAGAYFIACLYLRTVWTIFMPGADTPFGVRWTGPPYALQNLFFQFGKFYYFGAPILVGWAIGCAAARQRMKAIWPTVGLLLVALMGGTAEIHASRK